MRLWLFMIALWFYSILLYASLHHYVVTCDCIIIVTALYVFDSIFAELFDDVCFNDFCHPSSAFQHWSLSCQPGQSWCCPCFPLKHQSHQPSPSASWSLGISCTDRLLTHLKHLKTCSNESQSSAALPKGLVGRCHLDAARYQAPVVAILGDWQSTFKFLVIFAPLQIHILLLQSECVSTIYNQCGILA